MNFEERQKKAIADWEELERGARPRIYIGSATCGRAAGALKLVGVIEAELARHNIQADIVHVGCIGLCYLEPLVDIVKPGRPRISYANVTPRNVGKIIEEYLVNDNPSPELALGVLSETALDGIGRFSDLPMLKPQVRIVTANCGIIDPEKIEHYVGRGGYGGLVRALGMTPEQVIEEIKKSGLRGRGGAGFPTGMKWEFCRKAPGDTKYIICNADEGDPGAFMNRSLLESDPHSLLEGMLIGAYAMGATEAYIYVRAEYPLAVERLKLALKQMEEWGLVGDNILASNLSLHIKIKEGAGAFVCGEETALIASIEGRRGMPRPRPPFPAQAGLWGKPTNINNVETWADAASIMRKGAEWYAGHGAEKSKGTKTFALAGKINNTGLVEVPLGTPLRKIIYEIGGGIPDGKAFKAVQTGGPSGGCLPASLLDLHVEYESLAQAGAIMGSGGMVVMDEDTCMVDVARYFLTFTQSESCGKCVPCRVGTRKMLDILEDITKGKGQPEDIDLLLDLSEAIKAGSLCGLGQTAPNPVLTTVRYFRDEYEAHVREQRCPALACKDLIAFYILPDKCVACGICLRNCPAQAIAGAKKMVHVIDQSKCTKCSTCLDVCPVKFSAVAKVSGEQIEVPGEPTPVTALERDKVAASK
ncbi:MAG: NADH-quinone oxidoreductase subunit NuoF [Chloroflexi bacterium]|nr:NADH-quinone oxidoreductase subunit NuoF [Chloroflexota bacterium]